MLWLSMMIRAHAKSVRQKTFFFSSSCARHLPQPGLFFRISQQPRLDEERELARPPAPVGQAKGLLVGDVDVRGQDAEGVREGRGQIRLQPALHSNGAHGWRRPKTEGPSFF